MTSDLRPPDYFRCPRCQGPLLCDSDLRCSSCGALFAMHDGIANFIADGVETKLDDLDYDAFYKVDLGTSQEAFRQLKQALGDRIADRYGSLLEIGAGTGGMTYGLLTTLSVDHALITDISPKMLAICKRRLADNTLGQTFFATYSTAEDILQDNTLDCVVGSFVLHHVLDYRKLFHRLFAALRSNGLCIFMEPGYRFHKALMLTMIDVIENLISAQPSSSDTEDLTKLINWVSEVRFNLKFSGNAEILETREDKHFFRREDIETVSRDAGFGSFESIAYGSDDAGANAIQVYTKQLDLSEQFRETVLSLFFAFAPRHFELLSSADAAASYLLLLRKTDSQVSEPQLPLPSPQATPRLRHHTTLSLKSDEGGHRIVIDGWAISCSEVLYARVHLSDKGTFVAPVAGPRQDVQAAINASRGVPFEYAIFSGVHREETIPQHSQGRAVEGFVSYHFRDGSVIFLGDFSITADTPAVFLM